MGAIVVLNATYEPLGPTRLSRAIALIDSGRAVVDDHYEDRVITSAGGLEVPFPRVIRLLSYVNVPFYYDEEVWSRAGVLRRDNNTCGYCDKPNAKTVDHIIPRSTFKIRTDADTWENTVACCHPCNSKKADRTPEECGMELLIVPTAPKKLYISSNKRKRKIHS